MIDNDPITHALRAAQRPEKRCLWTEADAITFTPVVVSQIFGDGRALFGLTTINNRPAFWVVRGCSSWTTSDADAPDDAPKFIDFADDILDAIEQEFGTTDHLGRNSRGDWIDPETKRFVPREFTQYPVINPRDGRMWFRLDWPDLPGVNLMRHPFAHERILAPTFAMAA